ncbi:AraC-like DNA-binding protein [Algoriphagus sp. 4150]|uniref:AraC family transcriptional regulator n=1 Tax=Algoriphagus sp. 4150 TaxID=2817756 RepID=UPI00285F0E7D|nr:AraC family transcriptional regulator [Algoriphagus sp. 4150]MDR7130220.1 AraC-like DNA-binding protein [Algoriphagus sp. 4150]
MKPHLLTLSHGCLESFSVKKNNVPHHNDRWHFHHEIELIHFVKGEGVQFVGDSVKRFKNGDMVLIGAGLPHFWRFDESCLIRNDTKPSTEVLHFKEDFWGGDFLNIPENRMIKFTLEKAKRGIEITGATRKRVRKLLGVITTAEGSDRIIALLEMLSVISLCEDVHVLSSFGYQEAHAISNTANDRIAAVLEYSYSNFNRKIELEEIAEVAYLCPNYFCRYFKSRTGKTYTAFLNEIKIGHACRLLIENKECIKQIAYDSGFNNAASFYRFFKSYTGKSPLAYQNEYLNRDGAIAV